MKDMKKYLSLLILMSGTLTVSAQNLFKIYKNAEETFYEENFEKALELYQSIQELDTAYEDVPYKIDISKLLSDRQYTNMQSFLTYEEVMSKRDKFYYYWKGRVLLEEYKFEEAVESLNTFLKSRSRKSEEIIQEAKRWIDWSVTAKKYMDNPEYYEIHRLEEGVNSTVAELSPVYFTDKEELLFLSNRNENNTDEFQIYHTVHQGRLSWSDPKPVNRVNNLGTFSRDNSNIEVVAEDGRLFQFRTTKGGDLFYSEPTDSRDGWTDPVEFDSKVTSTHLSSHFFINEHEDRVIFSKNVGSKKEPNLDIFESFKDSETGTWSKPALFATTINSEFNEDSPYLSPDEQTLYFASDGHETMGGYDIFKSEYDEATQSWKEPVNLGFPINSPDDELHFKLNPDQVSGYYTSNRLNTLGDYDIFFFWAINTISIKGRIIDGPTGEPVTNARVFFRPLEYIDMYYYAEIDEDGQYETKITADDIFNVEIKMDDNQIIQLEDFEIHAAEGTNTTYIKDFYVGERRVVEETVADNQNENDIDTSLEGNNANASLSERPYPVDPEIRESPKRRPERREAAPVPVRDLGSAGGRAVVRNIYFDFDDSRIKDESVPILQALLNALTENPSMTVEIVGHTDNIGDGQTNQRVSERRAKAVMSWLVKNGVAANRLSASGRGESQPLATNDDEFEGRELNRRIEFIAR